MSILLSANKVARNVGHKSLFQDLNFGIFEKEKIGLIGPNGSGKSTLLKILAQLDSADSGEVTYKKNLNLSFVPQRDEHPLSKTIFEHSTQQIQKKAKLSMTEAEVLASTHLSIAGFEDTTQKIELLSGGWLKRLSLAIALATDPELLILDEPTNHMDWEGVLWLEKLLKNFKKSFLLVSHDRSLLEATTNRTIELNPAFKEGVLSYNLSYNAFLDKKVEHLESQQNLQNSLANKARRETEWLKAGVKARTTKSRSRMNEAHQLIKDLDRLNEKNRSALSKVHIEVDSTKRKTKKLIELKNTSIGFDDKKLVANLSLILGPQQCLGLLGHNGSGKTTLLKTIYKSHPVLSGSVYHADDLKLVYFEQKRSELPQEKSLVEYLGEGSDYVIFKEQSTHVASYASRFLFSSDRLNMPIHKLSGGEQARLLIAKIFLKPADVLILDEPTNDLDIQTISVLEEIILKFPGLVLIVSHDRSFLNTVCTNYLALDGKGEAVLYADLEQWLKKSLSPSKVQATETKTDAKKSSSQNIPKLSYKDKKFLENAENLILESEEELSRLNLLLETAVNSAESDKIQQLSVQIAQQQNDINELYDKWEQLEQIRGLSKKI